MTKLAELTNRLRRFASGPATCPPAGVERLAVAGRLVARLGSETDAALAAALGGAAVALARAARHAPTVLDDQLLDLLATLARRLEDLLAAADDGVAPDVFLGRQAWDRFAAIDLPADPDGPEVAPRPVLLLVASEFRRAAVRDKLTAVGVACEVADDPEAVLARLGGDPPPRWIVCDDQEPLRHLGRLRELLAAHDAGGPPLVLLVPGGTAAENLAARRGADLVWSEPFDPAALPD